MKEKRLSSKLKSRYKEPPVHSLTYEDFWNLLGKQISSLYKLEVPN